MTTALKIDFISDVSCPWCVIGLRSLDQALEALGDEVQAQIHFQPFELNPNMPAEGRTSKSTLPRNTAPRLNRSKPFTKPSVSAVPSWASRLARASDASTTPSMRTVCCIGPSRKASNRH